MTLDSTTIGLITTSVATIGGGAWAALKSFRKYVKDEADARIAEREDLRSDLEAKFLAKSLDDAKEAGAQNERIARLEGSLRGVRAVLYDACLELATIPGTEAVRARLKKTADEL